MKQQLLLSIRAQNPADPNTCPYEGSHHDSSSIHTCSHMNANINEIKEYDWPVGLWARSWKWVPLV